MYSIAKRTDVKIFFYHQIPFRSSIDGDVLGTGTGFSLFRKAWAESRRWELKGGCYPSHKTGGKGKTAGAAGMSPLL